MLKDVSKSKLVAVLVVLVLMLWVCPHAKGNYIASTISVVLLMCLVGLSMGIVTDLEVKTQKMLRLAVEIVVVVLLCWAEVEAIRRLELVLAVLLLLPLTGAGALVCEEVADVTRER
jgi:hypothetical protein